MPQIKSKSAMNNPIIFRKISSVSPTFKVADSKKNPPTAGFFEVRKSYIYFLSRACVLRTPSSSGWLIPSNSIPMYPEKPDSFTRASNLL
jgi:hypothetical protein